MYTRRHWNKAVFTKDQCNGTKFLQLNIYGTSLDDRPVSVITSITAWTLNVHCIKNVINSNGHGSEAHFEHDGTLCGCLWG